MLAQSSIAHYRLTGKLGEGGMGAVYRATDTKLHREVAVKLLPEAFASNPDRMARFSREAQVLAALNHPNIAAIYGVEESSGAPALIMELVEGPTLAERIAQGPMPLDEALTIAAHICHALEAAHVKGIIHRDLKPANVKITPEGQVKVLDFGLAKALDGGEVAAAASATASPASPTLTLAATGAGVLLGTAAYMSPEQARGTPADQRADIWAFGVVLYEMLTGRMTFGGETLSDTLASVLKTDPDFALLPSNTPSRIRLLLRRCLERDRTKRLHHMADARLELEAADDPAPIAAVAPRQGRTWLPWVVAALIPVAAAAGWWLHRPTAPPVLAAQFLLEPPVGSELNALGHAVSPDGRHLIVRARSSPTGGQNRLYLRDLAGTSYRELPGTTTATRPAWSPDNKSIVFAQDRKWRRLEIAGGAPTVLCEASASAWGASWGEQGTVLIANSRGPILQISPNGGTPMAVTKLDEKAGETAHAFPNFLPGGRYFLYTAIAGRSTAYVADLKGKEAPRRLLDIEGTEVMFASAASLDDGVLLFRRGESMMGVRFDTRRRTIVSDPFPILEKIPTPRLNNLPVSVSVPARVLLFSDERGAGAGEDLVLLDRSGKKILTVERAGQLPWGHLEFSPDGRRLLGNRLSEGTSDLWTVDLARGAVSRVTFHGGGDMAPAWSPDSRRIFYMARLGNTQGIRAIAADGTGTPQDLLKIAGHHVGASPDGKYVAFEAGRELRLLTIDKPGHSEVLIGGEAGALKWPQFSPDGRWLAYSSDETGRSEVYVQSFPPGQGKWQVSRSGGRLARWRDDGKELVFIEGMGTVQFYSVAVRRRGTGLDFDSPVRLFETVISDRAGGNYFAMSPDGKRFAMNATVPVAPGRPLTVMLDWMPALGR
ncbi:MAG TPA: protein kinase [Bryobacteraceae bacterium]|nr:protein kinase [Bryobacteraceae bacterium]